MADARGRGRPQATSHETLARRAFALFRSRGFANVTMPEIAAHVGIGRSTLFRYFPNKAAILWFRQEYDTVHFAGLLDERDDHALARGAFAAYTELYAETSNLEVVRIMVRTIETNAPEETGKWAAYEAWGRLVVGYVERRRGDAWSALSCAVAGRALWAAMWTATVAWAMSDEPHPAMFFNEAESRVGHLGLDEPDEAGDRVTRT